MLVPWQICIISIKIKSWENCKILGILHWLHDATKISKNVSTREWLPVMIRLLQSFYYTVLFFNMCNCARYGTYYAKEVNNMEELFPGNKEVLYLHKHSKDTQQEQQLTCEANKSSTMIPKLLVVLQFFQPNTSVQMVYEQVSNK